MAFEAVLAPDAASPKRWRRVTVIVSVAAHVAALAVGVAYSFWYVDELPLPAVTVTLAGAPPPPPPPPARRSSGKVRPKTIETPKPQLVQPKEHPKPAEEKPAPDEKDDPHGQEGGEKGGVAGGVQGGVVGAPVPATPKMLGAKVAHLQLLINPNVDPYKVQLPPALERLTNSGAQVSAIVRVCVSAQGDVTEVKVLRGADPAIDPQIPVVLRRWRYRPYQVDGRAEPFCYNFRYEVTQR